MLSEAIAGLQSCSVQEMQQFFPRKGQVLLAEEAWGGPLVWTDLRSLQVHPLRPTQQQLARMCVDGCARASCPSK